MEKRNLVIVHSFPTNSVLLQGLTDFLSDYFNVYMIDLPGFMPDVLPLKEISLEGYRRYVKEKIESFDLKTYWMAGVSFGFLVVDGIRDDKCLGFLAIEPYINSEFLKMSKFKKFAYIFIISIVGGTGIYKKIWGSRLLKFLLGKEYRKRMDILFSTIDARTFFETAKFILKDKKFPVFQDKPYVLVVNKKDLTIFSDKTISFFKKKANNLEIIFSTSEHYPQHMTKEYFQKHISEKEVGRMREFLESAESKKF
ncbi:MAG: hypothetical protein PHN74_01445 [Candidatus Pacebacteria bacterium]|nr:hypothetical protein [Candidatus Paceibacterota bacterium]